MTKKAIFFLHYSPSSASWLAYQLSKSLAEQHLIRAAFFYANAVRIADQAHPCFRNALNLTQAWSQLALDYQLPCGLCRSSVLQRNMITGDDFAANKSTYDNPPASRLATGFQLSSLTEFIVWKKQSQQVLVF